MYYKFSIFCFICFSFFVSCIDNKSDIEENGIVLDFHGDSLSFDDEFESLELIRLDNQTEALLSYPKKVIVNDVNVLILDNDGCTINAYSHDGTFLNKVGRKGHGHGEITQAYNFNSNATGDTIAVLSHHNVNIYDGKGVLIGNITFDDDEFWDDVLLWNSNLLLASYHRNTEYLLSKRNLKGEILKNYIKQKKDLLRMTPTYINQLQQDENSICFYDYPSSSFYLIDKKTELQKIIKLNSSNILNESDIRKSNRSEDNHDYFGSYIYDDGVIKGAFYTVQNNGLIPYNSRIDTNNMSSKLMRSNGLIYNFAATHDSYYYYLLPPPLLINLLQMDSSKMVLPEIMSKIKNNLEKQPCLVQETDNFYLLKMKAKQ